MPKKIVFMAATMNLSCRQELLEAIDNATPSNPVRIATVNPEFMLEAEHNQEFAEALAGMTHCIVDGSGLFFMMRIWSWFRLHQPIELYHGSDLVADLLQKYQSGDRRFFFLGGPPGQSDRAAEVIQAMYPKIALAGSTDGGTVDVKNVFVSDQLVEQLTVTKPDILTVGFGAPKQELWIQSAAAQLTIPVMVGVGGTLGFYTDKKRAPRLFRVLHLEWLYRGLTERGHWRRAWRAVVTFSFHALFWMGKTLFSPGNDER
ncbi:MAG: WecB/TagA/CpsF family glycosyltransferase [bacterium]